MNQNKLSFESENLVVEKNRKQIFKKFSIGE
jgi:hypothetical protein